MSIEVEHMQGGIYGKSLVLTQTWLVIPETSLVMLTFVYQSIMNSFYYPLPYTRYACAKKKNHT